MSQDGLTNSRIAAAYRERTRKSDALAREAGQLFPSGITHDSRHMSPYAVYIDRAAGARKWDVDGNEYVDYYGGHGALLLGHGRPEVVEAVQRQVARGTHFGASHELEVRWAKQVQAMVPSAERIRFTSSGTEANLMALRLARAFTGKRKILRFHRHFHGWQDHVAFGVANHFDGTPTPGVLADIAANTVLAPIDDIAKTRSILEGDDDIAAVILEPTGATFGQLPIGPALVAELRELTLQRGIILIFDEVVTGFRVSRGGAQAQFGIKPDLTSLAKILAGGLPGGAVCGRADILELLDFEKAAEKGFEKIAHQGTYNANPLSAAAGLTALQIIDREDACTTANAQAAKLRDMCNQAFAEEGVAWSCYGDFSGFYFFLNPSNRDIDPLTFDAGQAGHAELSEKSVVGEKLRLALLVNGVDITGKPGGTVSAAHTDNDLEATVNGLRRAIRLLKAEAEIEAA